MRTLLRLSLALVLALAPALAPAAAAAQTDPPRVLVVTAGTEDTVTADYAFERLGMEARRWNFELVAGAPEDLADLSGIDVVMFLNTFGDVLDQAQRESLRAFIEGGGGFVGTHSAAVTEPSWDWWDEMLGADAIEPPLEHRSERAVDFSGDSPITEGLNEDVDLSERWYYFDPEPAESDATVLGTLDSEDPVAWTAADHRVFYSVPGGWYDSWGERDFLQLIRQAIWWAAGETAPMVHNSEDVAPGWPYTLTVILFVAAVAGGGSIAVWRLDRADEPGAQSRPDTTVATAATPLR